jgi:hypothetical protein
MNQHLPSISPAPPLLLRARGKLTTLLALSGLALTGCGAGADAGWEEEAQGTARQGLASPSEVTLRWAPVHYQDIDKADGMNGLADNITAFNFDGDWNGSNNSNNLPGKQPPPIAYTHFAETSTHFLLSYIFIHPRDWATGGHLNDMEGVLEFVRKDGSTFGKLEGLMTVYHNQWLVYRSPTAGAYLSAGRAMNFSGTLGSIQFETSGLDSNLRPMTKAQAQGHGIEACSSGNFCGYKNANGTMNNDVLRYQPSLDPAPFPGAPQNNFVLSTPYQLIDMRDQQDGIHGHRFSHEMAADWGHFAGGAAGTPWGTAMGGSDYNMFWMFSDPAHAVSEYFAGFDNTTSDRNISLDYIGDNTIGTAHSWGGPWEPAEQAGLTDKAPAAASFENKVFLFTKTVGSGAQSLNFSTFDGSNWTNAQALPGGQTSDSPLAASECGGRLFVVAKPSTGSQTLKFISKANTGNPATGWGNWLTLTGASSNTSAALACRDNLFVFFKNSNNHISFRTITPSNNALGTQLELTGLTTNLAPAAATDPNSLETDVVAVGTDNHPYLNKRCFFCEENDWNGWTVHPGWTSTVSPVALAWDDVNGTASAVHMFTRASANRIEEDSWDPFNFSWRGPASVRGHQYTYLTPAAARANGMLYLFTVGVNASAGTPDQRIWVTQSNSPGRLLSFRKPTAQSSTYGGAGADRAVDGRTDSSSNSYFDGHIQGSFSSGFVTHTNQDNQPFWLVDLGSVHTITEVDVFNRTDCCANRLREWSVSVSNDGTNFSQIFHDSRASGAGRLTKMNSGTVGFNGSNAGTTNIGPWTGRFVRVQINRNAEWLHLGEVQVWGF